MSSIMIAAHLGDKTWAERVAARFRQALGDDNVLITFGPDDRQGWSFVPLYREETGARECRALLIVVGPAWRESITLSGVAEDPLGAVMAEAMENHSQAVLILAGGVELLPWQQLPEALRPLVSQSSVVLPEEGWQEYLDIFAEQFVPYVRGEARMAMGAPPQPDEERTMETRLEPAPAPAEPPPPPPTASRGVFGRFLGKIFHHAEPSASKESEKREPSVVEPESEPVMLGASAPRAVKPGDEFTARFVAYEKQLEAEVRDLLKKLSPRAEPVLGVQECRWQHNTRVTVKLSGRGLTIDPAEQAFIWKGGRSLLEFDVTVPANVPESTIPLKFDVAIEGFVVARLRLDLEIAARAVAGENATATAEPAKSAFASYSSKDRLRVLDRLAAVKISAGIDFFLDCLDLHPGEEWKPRLDNEIRQRDLFLLFWSKNASESKWVVWELETALKEKGEHALQLHPLDPDVKPPAGLEKFHVSDVVMWVRKGYEASQSH